MQDGLKKLLLQLKKSNICLQEFLEKTKQQRKKYRKFAISIDTIPYSPHWDIETRWNATCIMFESLIKQRIAMQLFYDNLSKGKHPVTDDDWDLLEEFVEMIKVFEQ